MKNLKDYLNEGLISRKITTKTPIKYKPKTKEELQNIIIDLLKKGITDLNCIDVSNITDMTYLFYHVDKIVEVRDINISDWDVSNVTDIRFMFAGCKNFNSDLSKWDVSNVKDMWNMFYNCTEFNCDLSKWDVSIVIDIRFMFDRCDTLKKNNKIPKWYK